MPNGTHRTTAAAIAFAVVLAAAAPAAFAGGGKSKTVESMDFDFGPSKVKISEGEKVKWVNVEGSHTVTFENGFNEVLSEEGDSTSRRFNKAGTYSYECSFHDDQGMRGKVVVR